jgi:hypothetical protein
MVTADKLKNGLAAVSIWLACVGVLVGLGFGFMWLAGEDALDAPGWDCSQADKFERTGECYPASGFR